jgi:hypothetical protein
MWVSVGELHCGGDDSFADVERDATTVLSQVRIGGRVGESVQQAFDLDVHIDSTGGVVVSCNDGGQSIDRLDDVSCSG